MQRRERDWVRSFGGALVLALAVSGCLPADDPSPGRAGAPIINGAREVGERSVVAVVRTGGLCTGTVIGPFAVLTAKHCVHDGRTPLPPGDFRVLVGHDLRNPGGVESVHDVVSIRTTPGTDINGDVSSGKDIAVLLLSADIGVPAIATSTQVPMVDTEVTVIGFGRTMTGPARPTDNGIKFIGAARVVGIAGDVVEASGVSAPCEGDSGGPLIDRATGDVIGVTSYGVDTRCVSPNAFYTRVDVHADLIDEALAFVPDCEPAEEICDGIDNDCNGSVDEGCTALGEGCSGDDECAGGGCETVGGSLVCVRACDPRDAIPGCPGDFYCESTGCGLGRCVAGVPGAGVAGAECSANTECMSLHCGDAAGTDRCGRSCARDTDPCPVGDVCEGAEAGCGVCIPVALSTGPRSLGAPCDTDAQCLDGTCDEGMCTRPCTPACPGGFHCRQALCRRGDLGGPGASCVTAEDCGELAPDCPDAGGDRVCAPTCNADGTCPAGLICGATDIGERCIAPGLALGETCEVDSECRSGACDGFCTRVCDIDDPCPEGFGCVNPGAEGRCFFRATPLPAEETGGCSVSAGDPAGGWPVGLLLLAAALFSSTRRRARRR